MLLRCATKPIGFVWLRALTKRRASKAVMHSPAEGIRGVQLPCPAFILIILVSSLKPFNNLFKGFMRELIYNELEKQLIFNIKLNLNGEQIWD